MLLFKEVVRLSLAGVHVFLVCISLAGCNGDSPHEGAAPSEHPKPDACFRSLPDDTRSIKTSVRDNQIQTRIRDALDELASLDENEFNERFGNDKKNLSALLASIHFVDIDRLLKEAGIDREENPGHWHGIHATFCSIKAKTDPHGYAEWILSKEHGLPSYVSKLGEHDPEIGIDVIQRSDLSPKFKADCYNALFQRAAEHDPHHAVRLFNSTEFKTTEQEGMALLGTFGFSSEIATPDKVREIVTGIPDDTLNAHPMMVKTLGGFFSQRPTEEVLARFPLDGQPWERTVAIRYLERRAFLEYTGDVDIEKILASDQARFLSEQEIGRLNTILGK